jgi:hypothetical protein
MYRSAIVVSISVGSFATCAAADQRDVCQVANGDKAISACDAVMASKKATRADRAAAFLNRGVEYAVKAIWIVPSLLGILLPRRYLQRKGQRRSSYRRL